jgi:glycosyltransferase involved in cell wall biosynthesis
MSDPQPLVSICIPHWQVLEMVRVCLRSIRKLTPDVSCEVLVVDNGSRDASLDYLRSVPWIRLIERGSEVNPNWVRAFAEALDVGRCHARGRYFLSMHTDVVVLREGWLRVLIDALESEPRHAAAGTGKLEAPSWLYAWWKRTMDTGRMKRWLRRRVLRHGMGAAPARPDCPRDFCALYRLDVLREHNLSFWQKRFSAGESMYLDLVECGCTAAMVPVPVMMRYIHHVAHATGGLRPEDRRLSTRHAQRKTERRLRRLFASAHVQALLADAGLDGGMTLPPQCPP